MIIEFLSKQRENGILLPLQIQYKPTKYKHASIAVIT